MNRKKRILIVDDDADCRAMLRKILSEAGYSVTQALNGLEALDLVKSEHPELIILDIMMPRMSGYDLATHLKQDQIFGGIPVILLSAKGSTQDVMKGYNECLVNYYITKPFSAKQLLTGIEMVLEDDEEEKPHVSCTRKSLR